MCKCGSAGKCTSIETHADNMNNRRLFDRTVFSQSQMYVLIHYGNQPAQCQTKGAARMLLSRPLLTSVGEFWSGQKDSGMGQCPTGTPVFGFGRT